MGEKKYLAVYLKKSAPDAQFRKEVEDRIAEIKADAELLKAAAAPAEEAPAAETPAAPAEQAPAAESPKSAPAAAPAESPVDVAGVGATTPIAKANIYFKAGSLEQALQMYRTVVDSEGNPEERYFAMLQMGNIYRELRDFHSAVSRYREVVQQYPDSDWERRLHQPRRPEERSVRPRRPPHHTAPSRPLHHARQKSAGEVKKSP